jgi:hypothetical protein
MAEEKTKENSSKSDEKKTKGSKKKGLKIGLVIVAVIAIAAVAISIYSVVQLQNAKKNPQKLIQQETKSLIEAVSKHIDVPRDEEPTVATVNDKDKLKDQPFFNNAQNGDKVLVFTKAKKAIIFRESEDRLINVGPLSIDQGAQVGVAVLGAGGNVQAATKTITDKLGTAAVISFSGDAKNKNEVSKTTVVDVSGTNGEAAKQIASALGGEVAAKLPSGETTPPNTAIVVIYK